MNKVVIAGAIGLVGKQLVVELAGQEGVETHIIVRRKPERVPAGVIVHEAPPVDWAAEVAAIKADVAISCLGTTMKIAGSKAAFRAVDFDLVAAFSQAAKQAGARHMIAVSSVGTSDKSANFYLKTKGEAETAMAPKSRNSTVWPSWAVIIRLRASSAVVASLTGARSTTGKDAGPLRRASAANTATGPRQSAMRSSGPVSTGRSSEPVTTAARLARRSCIASAASNR